MRCEQELGKLVIANCGSYVLQYGFSAFDKRCKAVAAEVGQGNRARPRIRLQVVLLQGKPIAEQCWWNLLTKSSRAEMASLHSCCQPCRQVDPSHNGIVQ